jgi:8-amino-7-oxononanoate synthase
MGMIDSLTNKMVHNKLELEAQGLFRKRQIASIQSRLNFSSNDYLSLTKDVSVQKAFQDGYAKYPVGSSGSVVISGYHQIHRDLEKYYQEALGVDDCILFSSGYAANLAVISLLAKFKATLLIDKSIHASIYDGIKLNNANYYRYQHNDLLSLNQQLVKNLNNTNDLVILTESIFSMSGQIANLKEISKLKSNNTNLIVDEAHGFGILGEEGLGGVMHSSLTQNEVALRVIPFGKSVGGSGAIVAGRKAWIDALVQTRPVVYTTAISPAFAYGLLKTTEIMRASDYRREKIIKLVLYFRDKIKQSNFRWRDSQTPIQQLQLGCQHLATAMAKNLLAKSIICLPIRQPTVTKIETGLRVILNYHHEPEDIDYLFDSIHKL